MITVKDMRSASDSTVKQERDRSAPSTLLAKIALEGRSMREKFTEDQFRLVVEALRQEYLRGFVSGQDKLISELEKVDP